MELLPLLLKAIFVGLIVAAPMGPVNIIIIHRTITKGKMNAFLTGSGGALGDAVFAIVAALGLTAAQHFITEHEFWFRLPGGLLLLFLGYRLWMREPHMERQRDMGGLFSSISTTFLLTITNPITAVAFIGLFVSLGLSTGFDYVAAGFVVLGVTAGSMLWWAIVTTVVGMLHGHIEDRHLKNFNKAASVAVILFGIYAIDSVTLELIPKF